MRMCPENDNKRLHITRDHSRHGSADNSERRGAELSVDQNIIQRQIDAHCCHARRHGKLRLAALPQRACINFLHGKRNQSRQHDKQIISSVFQRCL